MAKKRGLPFWLGLLLLIVLAALLLMVALAPEHGRQARLPEPVGQATVRPPAARAEAPETGSEAAHESMHQTTGQTAPKSIEKPLQHSPHQAAPVAAAGHGLSLILDDVGYNIPALKRILALSVPVAISVLPDSPNAGQAARLAHRAGQVVMLHLPMQPIDPSLSMSNAFLIEGMTKSALHDTFLRDLAQVPFVEGVNNHMGSRLTQLPEPMRQVMQICLQQGLFFVDSRTTANSVAATVARRMGLRWATRQIFLDHIMTPEAMGRAWDKARSCVRKGHRCIIIAHPREASVAFLESHLNRADADSMVSIKQLLRSSAPTLHLSSLQTL